MRKVMIADDESLVRIGLQSMIDWEAHDFELKGVFKNGEELLQAARKDQPDVVLTDIRMPKMDGFALIEALKNLNQDIHILILSSYDDIHYTRRAIKLGVNDYIPKHEIEPGELIKVLQSLPYRQKADEQNKKQTMLSSAKLLEWSTREPVSSAQELEDIFPHAGDAGCWLTMKMKPREQSYNEEEKKALLKISEQLFSRLRNFEFIGIHMNTVHSLYFLDTGHDSKSSDVVDKIAQEWRNTVYEQLNIEAIIGISECGNWRKNAATLRSQAESMLQKSFYREVGVSVYKWEKDNWVQFTEKERLELQAKIKRDVVKKRFSRILELIDAIKLKKQESLLPSEWDRLYQLIYMYMLDLFIQKFEQPQENTLQQFSDQLKPGKVSFSSFVSFQYAVKQLIQQAEQSLEDYANHQTWIQQAKDYIKEHYDQPIKLEHISKLVHLSENYISLKFREQTGDSFSDYVTKVRIEKAKEFIESGDWTTEEIAYQVGYPNANYFIKVFKKITGETVTSFKRRTLSQQ